MFNKIIDFLKSQDWLYTIIEDQTIAILGISGKNGKFQCIADIRENEKRFVFYSICNANVPKEKQTLMSEFLTMVNQGIFLGNFEMNFDIGEIRYKTSFFYDNLELSNSVIKNMIITNIAMMDNSLTAIMQLIYSDISAIQATDLIEKTDKNAQH